MIKSVLIANRGEIAIRIARTARRMGIKTYVVRTAKEPEAVYLSAADAVINFPETDGNIPEFLDIDRLVGLAREYKIDSLHPGYGYLSENAELAERCRDNGIVFIGPSPEVIRLMGDKVAAKGIAAQSGVPMLGASQGAVHTLDDLPGGLALPEPGDRDAAAVLAIGFVQAGFELFLTHFNGQFDLKLLFVFYNALDIHVLFPPVKRPFCSLESLKRHCIAVYIGYIIRFFPELPDFFSSFQDFFRAKL